MLFISAEMLPELCEVKKLIGVIVLPLKSCSSAGQSVLGLFPCAALQNRLTTAFCHCSDIHWYLPFTQAWIGKPLKSCNSAGQTVLGLFPCAALQNRLTTAFCHCSELLKLVFTQAWIGKPLKSCSSAGQTVLGLFPVLLCKTGWQQFFVTAVSY